MTEDLEEEGNCMGRCAWAVETEGPEAGGEGSASLNISFRFRRGIGKK